VSWIALGLIVALAVHAAVSTAVALVVVAAGPLADARLRRASPARRARTLFALALAPSLAGLCAVLAIVVPAWLAHEPRGGGEGAGPLAWTIALAGAGLVVARVGSALRLARRTSRAVSRWARGGTPVGSLPLPATRFAHPLPVAALAGFVRPRLLLAEGLVAALDPSELQAVAAHELGHAAARDNLRRLLLAASPDVLAWLPAGARLRRGFEQAAEAAADRRAVERVRPETLARALLKAAALVPEGRRLGLPLATFDGAAPLAERVRALVAGPREAFDDGHARPAVALAALGGLVLSAIAVLSVARPEAHAVLEALVRALD
jgi:Zn-dependent protease with chaperone function